MTDIEQEARAEALARYSHANVRDRYDADLLMAGFADGAEWAASRTVPVELTEEMAREHKTLDEFYAAEHGDQLVVRAHGEHWLSWETPDGEWFAIRPRSEDDSADDEWRPMGPVRLDSLRFPIRCFEIGDAFQSLAKHPAPVGRTEPTEETVEAVAEAIREEMAANGDFDPTYDYTDDAMRYARAALRAVPGETNEKEER